MDSAGFFLCDHCHQVVSPAQSVLEAALSLPGGRLVDLKCPRCGWNDVSWRPVNDGRHKADRQPVSRERAHWWFKHIRNSLNLL